MAATTGTASAAGCAENRTNATAMLNNFDLFDTATGTRPDGLVSTADLREIATAGNIPVPVPSSARAAAQYFLANTTEWRQLETAGNGQSDGLVSRNDLEIFRAIYGCIPL
ncbi:hypothetical protein AB0O28_37265 [Microbispora sp. NPDC088329]|uniref:hypothetical protein n=1 Tax=Microbispora sp. NPDC088329 TaxID=3154869 RepID=UPI0034132308